MHGSESPFRPSVLVIGNDSIAEFQPALGWLREVAGELTVVGEVDHQCFNDSLRHPHSQKPQPGMLSFAQGWPELVVFLQNRPGEFSQAQVDQIHSKWPLAILLVLAGSWCEGEMRTGRPLSGVVHLPWHRWEAALGLFWEFGEQPNHPWRLPRTRTWPDELLAETDLATHVAPRFTTSESGRHGEFGGEFDHERPLVAVEAAEPGAYDSLRAALVEAGYSVARWRDATPGEVDGAAVVIWDEPGWGPRDLEQLERCVRHSGTVPVIAILGMLRWEDSRIALRWGAAAVIAKPLRLAELYWHVRRWRGARRTK